MIRPAEVADLDALVALSAAKRRLYETWQPVFQRPAPDADHTQRAFLEDCLRRDDLCLRVAERDGKLQGWLMARLVDAPPVYAPGGKILFVDDFCVAEDSLWAGVGRELLNDAWGWGHVHGAVLVNVVCGPEDEAKRTLLARMGLSVASEWHVGVPAKDKSKP